MLSPPSPNQLADIDPVYYFYIPPIRQFEVEPLPFRVNLAKLSENSHYKLDVHIGASDCDVDVTTNSKLIYLFLYWKYQTKDPYRDQSLMFSAIFSTTTNSLPLSPM